MTQVNLKEYETSSDLAEVKAVYKSTVKASDRPKINSSRDAHDILKRCFNSDTIDYTEEFLILLLNRNNKVLGWVKISSGGISGTVADKKVIFAIALQTGASSIILAHNHPSGNLSPSKNDETFTESVKKAGVLLEIPVLDHIIITDEGFYSFADSGLIYQK